MSPSPSNQSTKETHRKVMAVFAKYNTDGFALIPHTNRYARWLFKHVWLLPIILLFLLMVAIAIATGKADNRQEKFLTQTLFIATTTFVLPFFLSVAIDGWAVGRLTKIVPRFLFELANSGRLGPTKDLINDQRATKLPTVLKLIRLKPLSWETYCNDFESALHSPLRFLWFGGWLLIGYILSLLLARQSGALFQTDLIAVIVYKSVMFLLAPALLAYSIAFGSWFIFIVALYIRWIVPTFELDILPWHWDQSGGLKRVGDLSLYMAALTIPPALMFGFWLLYKLVPPLPISEASTIFVLLGVTGLSIMAVVVFFRPMWKIHGAMVRAKADFQNKAALIIFPKETRLRELIGQGKWKDNETRELEEQLEKLRKIYPPDLKYRTWPFNSGILLAFFTTQIAPIITLFTVLRDFT